MAEFYEKDNLEIQIERTKAEYAGIEFEEEPLDLENEEETKPSFDAEKIRVE